MQGWLLFFDTSPGWRGPHHYGCLALAARQAQLMADRLDDRRRNRAVCRMTASLAIAAVPQQQSDLAQ